MADTIVKSSLNTDAIMRTAVSQAAGVLRMPLTGFSSGLGQFDNVDRMKTDNVKIRGRKRIVKGGVADPRGTQFRTIGNRYVEASLPVRTYGAKAEWTARDEGVVDGENIPQNDANAVVEDCMIWSDELAFDGSAEGLSASDSFARSTAITQLTDLTEQWTAAGKTAAEIAGDISDMYAACVNNAEGTGPTPDTLAIPPDVYASVAMKARDGVEGSVLTEAVRNLGIRIVPIQGLGEAADSGQTGRAIMYPASPRVGVWAEVLEPTFAETFVHGFRRERECLVRSAGFYWIDSAPVVYLDNVG